METETETGIGNATGRMPEPEIFITVSDALEYLFCPRFIFFMHCLGIAQREERRYKVLKGRELHEIREKVNRDYVRKKLNCTGKEISVYLTSHKYHFKGEVDEVLFLDDGTAAPLDYKYAEFKNTIYRTHKFQAALYGLLISTSEWMLREASCATPGAIIMWRKSNSGKNIMRKLKKLCVRY